MEYSEEQLQQAMRLAKHLAKGEAGLQVFQDPTYGKPNKHLLNFQRERIGDDHAKLIVNPLAEELLPQARVIVRMEEERQKAIEDKTPLGMLIDQITNLEDFLGDRLYSNEQMLKNPFKEEIDNEYWSQFVEGMRSGNRSEALLALSGLLTDIKMELVWAELPPTAPDFKL